MKKIKNILENIRFWLDCTRAYSLPITILNGIVAYLFALKHNGNPWLGLFAIIGSCLVHLATNLIDDYLDYKILIKNENFMKSAQNCKCIHIKSGKTNLKEIKNTILILLLIAAFIGCCLFFISGPYVFLLAVCGLIVALTYQKCSYKGLGELSVILAFGPLLYEGIYYVMTSAFSLDLLILAFACALFTNTILYTHMLMDYDGDECVHKKTLCRFFGNKTSALNFILFFYITSFVLISYLAIKTNNYWYLLGLMTIPTIIDLYKSLAIYGNDKTNIPKIYPWHYPLDNWDKVSKTPDAPFYFRFFYSRNIMTNFMILICLAIILD